MLYHFYYLYRCGHFFNGPFWTKGIAEQVRSEMSNPEAYTIVCKRWPKYVGNQERKRNNEAV